MSRLKSFVAAISLCTSVPFLSQADIAVDVDPITPGIQASYTVTSGTLLTIPLFFDPTISGPVAFDAVGLDMYWSGSATATPVSPFLAGPITIGLATDFVTGAGPIGPGTPLFPAGLPSAGPPGSANMGGAGHADSFAYGAPPGGFIAPVDLMGVSFIISGAPGDSVTFTPSGIFIPGSPTSVIGAGPFAPGGDPLIIGIAGPTATSIPQVFLPGTITIVVPEPSTLSLLGMAGLLIFFIRRRKRF